MRTTDRLGLKLIEGSDPVSWGPFNEDMEKLEAAVGRVEGSKQDSAVGDVLFTLRAGLGPEWRLCDGSTIRAVDYPALAGALSPAFTEEKELASATGSGSSYCRPYCMATDGKKWVAGGGRPGGSSGHSCTPCIAWADAPGGEWHFVTISANTDFYVSQVAYGNGLWCAMITHVSGSEGAPDALLYARDPAGPWTKAAREPPSGTCFLGYVNGLWVVGRGSYDEPSADTDLNAFATADVAWAQTPDGPWTIQRIANYEGTHLFNFDGARCRCRGVVYRDGYYAALVGRAEIYRAPSLSGPWTKASEVPGFPAATSTTDNSFANGLGLAGGYYVLWCSLHHYGAAEYAMLAWAAHPAGPWQTKTLWGGSMKAGIGNLCGFVSDGMVMVGGTEYETDYRAIVAHATRPGGDWTVKRLWGGTQATGAVGVAFAGGYLTAVGNADDGATRSWRLGWGGGATRALPKLEGAVPAYIKVR